MSAGTKNSVLMKIVELLVPRKFQLRSINALYPIVVVTERDLVWIYPVAGVIHFL